MCASNRATAKSWPPERVDDHECLEFAEGDFGGAQCVDCGALENGRPPHLSPRPLYLVLIIVACLAVVAFGR